jgi:hypothetical protein
MSSNRADRLMLLRHILGSARAAAQFDRGMEYAPLSCRLEIIHVYHRNAVFTDNVAAQLLELYR